MPMSPDIARARIGKIRSDGTVGNMVDSDKVVALTNWLTAGAPPSREFSDLVAEIGQRIVSAGISVDQFGIYVAMLHSELPGRLTYWTAAGGSRLVMLTPEQLRSSDSWIGTPAEVCQKTGRMVVYTLGSAPEFDAREDSQALAKRGYRQFVHTPLHSNYSIAGNTAAYGTKVEGGFKESEVHALRTIQAALARVVEGFVLHEGTVQVLSTYVGRGAGRRVLEGNILRGDTEVIPSIVLFTDLKGFTGLSNSKPATEIIDMLNTFYEISETAISKNGGEILKFIGDGLLVIFPTPDDLAAQMAASAGAIDAVYEIHNGLKKSSHSNIAFRSSLHLGDIFFGNIGSKSRLDFTAIGPTVNLAARMLECADELGADTVCSDAFHQLVPSKTKLLGERAFKGFDLPQKIYGVGR
jgi:adenylate cyclase